MAGEVRKIVTDPFIDNNPILLQILGICSALAVTSSLAPALTMGLAIVNTHNVWVAGWPVIITIFGWLAIIGGIMRITMPGVTRTIAEKMLDLTNFFTFEAFILIGLGAWLSYVGYLA